MDFFFALFYLNIDICLFAQYDFELTIQVNSRFVQAIFLLLAFDYRKMSLNRSESFLEPKHSDNDVDFKDSL